MAKNKIEGATLDDIALSLARGFEWVKKNIITKDYLKNEFKAYLDSKLARLGRVEYRNSKD